MPSPTVRSRRSQTSRRVRSRNHGAGWTAYPKGRARHRPRPSTVRAVLARPDLILSVSPLGPLGRGGSGVATRDSLPGTSRPIPGRLTMSTNQPTDPTQPTTWQPPLIPAPPAPEPPRKSWFARHKIITGLLALVLIGDRRVRPSTEAAAALPRPAHPASPTSRRRRPPTHREGRAEGPRRPVRVHRHQGAEGRQERRRPVPQREGAGPVRPRQRHGQQHRRQGAAARRLVAEGARRQGPRVLRPTRPPRSTSRTTRSSSTRSTPGTRSRGPSSSTCRRAPSRPASSCTTRPSPTASPSSSLRRAYAGWWAPRGEGRGARVRLVPILMKCP